MATVQAVGDAVIPELTWRMSHVAMYLVDQIHLVGQIPYWEAIVCATLCIRIAILPIAVQTIKNAARMAALRPDMQKLQDVMNADPNVNDQRVKQRYIEEMKALFLHHRVNPLRAFAMPLVQLPLFISFFFGLQEMHLYFPAYTQGGDFWFANLVAADSTMILPIANSLSFLAMVEMGADGIQTSQQQSFRMVMRGMAVLILPLTMHMSSGLFLYWNTNNLFSIVQTLALRNRTLKTMFDIPDPPKVEDTPLLKLTNPFSRLMEGRKSTAEVEVIEGGNQPPPPPLRQDKDSAPVTFAAPPRKRSSS
jgi:YidC/Oxa1 family membrane protein insertase